MGKLTVIILSLFIVSCSSAVRYANSGETGGSGNTLRGQASFYADKFNGRATASGEIFDNSRLTAAHRTLPFFTKVKVTNLKNGKSVVVVINDRGPFAEGRIIDLSKAAAEALGMVGDGIAEVEMEILE